MKQIKQTKVRFFCLEKQYVVSQNKILFHCFSKQNYVLYNNVKQSLIILFRETKLCLMKQSCSMKLNIFSGNKIIKL